MAFATSDELAARLTRTFSTAETATADLLLELATIAVTEAAGKDDDWADTFDDKNPAPKTLRLVTVEVAKRAMANPEGLASLQKQLGAFSSSKTFRRDAEAAGVALTDRERLMVRRAVRGRTSGSARVGAIVNDLEPCTEELP